MVILLKATRVTYPATEDNIINSHDFNLYEHVYCYKISYTVSNDMK